jgi:TatD DNase family protein
MKLIDTHTHICDAVFDDDRANVLERAREAGVQGVVAIGENLSDARKNLMLADEHLMLLPGAGLYPTVLDLDQAAGICDFIRAESSRLACIGEVGLDFWKVKEEDDQELQREIFRGFIKLSNELELPLNVHSRSAGRHAIAMLLEEGGNRVQLHAFDGKASTALPAVEAGFYFSGRLPVECMLVETDSPVLGPEAGQRNEPANVRISLETIAEIKEIPLEAVAESLFENTERLYGRSLS